jgi:guanine deaminase
MAAFGRYGGSRKWHGNFRLFGREALVLKKNGKKGVPGKVAATEHKRLMQMAIDLSEQALDCGKGGPFGAIIVKGARIVGSSGNRVFKHMDPTSHAEIMAIRDACGNLQTEDLIGCRIYSSGEPCPMCMAAIYWAKMDEVFFSNTEKQSLSYGFIDKLILEELRKDPKDRRIVSTRIENPSAIKVFEKAKAKNVPSGKVKKLH